MVASLPGNYDDFVGSRQMLKGVRHIELLNRRVRRHGVAPGAEPENTDSDSSRSNDNDNGDDVQKDRGEQGGNRADGMSKDAKEADDDAMSKMFNAELRKRGLGSDSSITTSTKSVPDSRNRTKIAAPKFVSRENLPSLSQTTDFFPFIKGQEKDSQSSSDNRFSGQLERSRKLQSEGLEGIVLLCIIHCHRHS